MAKIKICGLTRLCDIEFVNEEKPEYIGFVLADSRRKVAPRQAEELRAKLCADIIPVGVFINEAIKNIISLTKNGIIGAIQLHGSEDEEYIKRLKSLTDKPVIKAVFVQNNSDILKWEESSADYLLFDSKSGGSGRKFDWSLIGETDNPYFLAGGLNLENITGAIEKTKPFAVDVSSGVETDGLKDHIKIKEFIRRVKSERK